MSVPIPAPDGHSYKLKSLQRDYLRYYVVEYLQRSRKTWAASYEKAAEILEPPSKKKKNDDGPNLKPGTIANCHGKIKNVVLAGPGMKEFCRGLEHDYQIAMAENGKPAFHTYFDPDTHLGGDHS